jgi:TusA-related sulfurtransferase
MNYIHQSEFIENTCQKPPVFASGIFIAILSTIRRVPLMKPIADYTVDFRGAIRWMALLKVTQLFRGMNPHQTIEVLGLDPDTRADLLKVLPEISYEILGIEEDADALSRLRLRKRDVHVHRSIY